MWEPSNTVTGSDSPTPGSTTPPGPGPGTSWTSTTPGNSSSVGIRVVASPPSAKSSMPGSSDGRVYWNGSVAGSWTTISGDVSGWPNVKLTRLMLVSAVLSTLLPRELTVIWIAVPIQPCRSFDRSEFPSMPGCGAICPSPSAVSPSDTPVPPRHGTSPSDSELSSVPASSTLPAPIAGRSSSFGTMTVPTAIASFVQTSMPITVM